MKYALIIASVATLGLALPANADDARIGVGVGPVGAGVTVGSSHDRDHNRDRNVIVRDREPRDKTVIIHKDRDHDRDRGDKVIIREHNRD